MQNKTKKRKLGDLGEELASMFLMKRGVRVFEINYLKPWGEIDLIARKGKTIHFIEVKSVSCVTVENRVSRETLGRSQMGEALRPEEHVTREKKERLGRAIQTYLADHHISRETPFQVDVVTVKIDTIQKTAFVELFERVM